MAVNGVLHVARTRRGLPTDRALCGAVGTSFLGVGRLDAPRCERCAQLERRETDAPRPAA